MLQASAPRAASPGAYCSLPGSRNAPAVLSPHPGCGRRGRLFLLGRLCPAPGRLGLPSLPARRLPRRLCGSRRVPGPVRRVVRPAGRAAAAAAVAAAVAPGPAVGPLHGFPGPGHASPGYRPCLVFLWSSRTAREHPPGTDGGGNREGPGLLRGCLCHLLRPDCFCPSPTDTRRCFFILSHQPILSPPTSFSP